MPLCILFFHFPFTFQIILCLQSKLNKNKEFILYSNEDGRD